jgi:multidrug efflux pump subunit AcrB
MAIVLVYSDYVPIDRVTFVTSLFLFVALLLAFGLLKKFVPKSREAKMQIRAERERKRRARAKKRLQKRMLKLKKKAELQNL